MNDFIPILTNHKSFDDVNLLNFSTFHYENISTGITFGVVRNPLNYVEYLSEFYMLQYQNNYYEFIVQLIKHSIDIIKTKDFKRKFGNHEWIIYLTFINE